MFGVELFGNVGLLVHDSNEKVGRRRERKAKKIEGQIGLSMRFLSPLSLVCDLC